MSLPKAVVFLGGGATEVELIQAFGANDIRVVLVDRNVDAPGREFADEFINLSVTASEAICNALSVFGSRYCFVAAYGIVDYAFETISVLTQKFKISPNPPAVYEDFTDKLKTKVRFGKFGVSTPRTVAHGTRCDASVLQTIASVCGSGMVVIKAHNACNSEGVRIVQADQEDRLRHAIIQAIQVSGGFFCEEFVKGTLHNLDLILSTDRVSIVAITDRYRMPDGLTSLAGLQLSPQDHPLYVAFEQLAAKTWRMFSDYCGPLTADILASEGALQVLEMSPHLHAAKLQWLRDPGILEMWPRILARRAPVAQRRGDSKNGSAYVRIYGDKCRYEDYFDPSWIVMEEEFRPPRWFGMHALQKILYMKAASALLLREHLHAFVRETEDSAPTGANSESYRGTVQ